MCTKIQHVTFDSAMQHKMRLIRMGAKRLHIYRCQEGCVLDKQHPYHVGHPRGKAVTKSRKRKRGVW